MLQEIHDFGDLELKENLLRGIFSMGFEKPSNIQSTGILPFLNGNDVVIQASSGQGKSLTYLISTLQIINENENKTQAIILLPTKELLDQVYDICNQLKSFTSIRIQYCGKNINYFNNCQDLKKSLVPHVIIGTPGRVLQLLQNAFINTRNLKCCIFDEADVLLRDSFKDQCKLIYTFFPETVQIGLYTATIDDNMEQLINRLTKNPTRITVTKENLTLSGIKQYGVRIENKEEKFQSLLEIYQNISIYQVIIYCNNRNACELLCRQLANHDMPSACIHANIEMNERNSIMQNFRSGSIRNLITTDLLCRGIDVQQVSLVINYDFPTNTENYLHRIGRSGRWGRKGFAINFVTKRDINIMRGIEEHYKININELPMDFKFIV
jgi:translation initiation factor 4A